MSKRTQIDIDTLTMFDGLTEKVKESRNKERKQKPFTKPNSDYYRLDLIVRDTKPIGKGERNALVEDIKTDYRAYLDSVRGTQSITKYIHGLIDADMKKHKKTGDL